ncbi:acyl-ACP--UDP-N-acetylglucosamine O-acyltransferase [bacterium]|nr:acyl-ACP--UDP-N-acetylglucosamine O-acyltransferase [bacterium]
MPDIHPNAIVHPEAQIGEGTQIDAFAIIEENVTVGSGCRIGSCSRLKSGTRLGKDVIIAHGAVLGSEPQDLKFAGEKTELFVGDRSNIREFCTLNRGTGEGGQTRIGKDCLLMTYVHVAHDCILGDNVILANSVNMAGHVVIEDFVIVGGVVPIHQFVRIGCHAMVGGGFRVPKDVTPYILAGGEPLSFSGLNSVGLRRRGFSNETRRALQQAYRILYRSGLNVKDALLKIEAECEQTPEVKHLVAFIRESKRGILPAPKRGRSRPDEAAVLD